MSTTELINKGKALAQSATQKANAAVNDFIQVPGFKNYAINSKDVLKSIATGNIQQIPKGKKKFLIFADDKTRKSIGLEDIKKLIGPRAPVKLQPAVKGDKPTKKKELILSQYNGGIKDIKIIAANLNLKSNTVYECIYKHRIGTMYKEGKTAQQISDETGYGLKSIERQITKYFSK